MLDGGPYDEHVEASHGTYNVRTEVGTFYSAIGTVGLRMRNSRYVLTTSNPFAFTGKIVEKHGPDHYLVRAGYGHHLRTAASEVAIQCADAFRWMWTAPPRSTTAISD